MYDISKFNPRRHKPQKVGPAGRVYDLHNGTVLEIVKESGRAEILNAAKALRFLEKIESVGFLMRRKPPPFKIPKVLDVGAITRWQFMWPEDYVAWMLSTKLEGNILTAGKVRALTQAAKQIAANALGSTLANLHTYLRETGVSSRIRQYPNFQSPLREDAALFGADIERGLSSDDGDRLECVRDLVANRIATFEPIHGSFSLSNIMFTPDLGEAWSKVSGIQGFAPRMGYIEDDLSGLTTRMPFLKRALIKAYEQASNRKVDQKYMAISEARTYLIEMIVDRYKNYNFPGAILAQNRLDDVIECLERLRP